MRKQKVRRCSCGCGHKIDPLFRISLTEGYALRCGLQLMAWARGVRAAS